MASCDSGAAYQCRNLGLLTCKVPSQLIFTAHTYTARRLPVVAILYYRNQSRPWLSVQRTHSRSEYFMPSLQRRHERVLYVLPLWTELETSQDYRKFRNWTCLFFCSFVLSRNAVWTEFCLISTQFPLCNCSVSNVLRTIENCLDLSPIQFNRRHGQDKTVLSVPAVWTRH